MFIRLPIAIIILLVPMVATAKDFNICLTGTTVKVIGHYGQAFLNGAQLAVDNLSKSKRNFAIKKHFFDPAPLASVDPLKKMYKENCRVIIGFDSTNEIVAGKSLILEHPEIPVITLYSQLTKELKEIQNLISFQQPSLSLVRKVVDHVLEKRKGKGIKKALIVTSVDKLNLVGYRESYIKVFKEKKIDYSLTSVVERNLKIKNFIGAYKKDKSIDVVVVLARSMLSAKIVNHITANYPKAKQPIFIGTANWGSSKLQAFFDRLQSKKIGAYFGRQNSYFDPDRKFQDFVSLYKQKYSKDPMVISALAYDAVMLTEKALQMAENKDAKLSFAESLRVTSFVGVTGLEIDSGVVKGINKGFVLKVTPDGYRLSK